MRTAQGWLLAGLVLIGLGLRFQSMRGDLWFDEVSSLEFARLAASPQAIFTAIHRDNNHYLNTLWLYGLGDGRAAWAYRSLAFAACCLMLVWIVTGGFLAGRFARLAGAVLIGGSFFLVVPLTEARGYAGMLLAVLAAWRSLELAMAGRPGPWALAFGICASLACLFQLTALVFLVGAGLWVLGSLPRLRQRAGGLAAYVLRLFALPVVTVVSLYLVDIRRWQVGGGPLVETSEAAGRAAALALGLPEAGLSLFLGPLLLATAVLSELHRRRREGDSSWLLYGGAIFVGPAAMLALSEFPTTYARYFLVPVVMSLLLLAACLGRWWRSGPPARVATVAVLVLIGSGNAVHFTRFLGGPGRGQYTEAVERIVSATERSPATIASDHDFRTRIVLEFLLRRDHPDFAFRYVEVSDWERQRPEWLVLHSPQRGLFGQPILRTPGGSYRLAGTYRHYGASGFDWFVYRRAS